MPDSELILSTRQLVAPCTHPRATLSLWIATAGWLALPLLKSWLPLPGLAFLMLALPGVAVVLGVRALRAVRRHPGAWQGRGLALGGVCTGAGQLALVLAPLLLS